jgi:hypothetical protein
MEGKTTERRGYLRQLASQFEEGAGVLMKTWKARAKRSDPVGDAAYRGLELVHGGLKLSVQSLSRLERATQPPHRASAPEPPALAKEAVKRPARPEPVRQRRRSGLKPARS